MTCVNKRIVCYLGFATQQGFDVCCALLDLSKMERMVLHLLQQALDHSLEVLLLSFINRLEQTQCCCCNI